MAPNSVLKIVFILTNKFYKFEFISLVMLFVSGELFFTRNCFDEKSDRTCVNRIILKLRTKIISYSF